MIAMAMRAMITYIPVRYTHQFSPLESVYMNISVKIV